MNDISLADYRWPAEWEPHAATWVAWPVNPKTWPGLFDRIPAAFAEFVATIAKFEPVSVLVGDPQVARMARPLLDAACSRTAARCDVTLVDIPVNDSWCRDYGPIFLNRSRPENPAASGSEAQLIVNWGYNAWGGKYPPWDKDAQVAESIATRLQIPQVTPGIILEGGAIEGNGAGTLLTTENCLLNPNRNPDLSRHDMETVLQQFLNVQTVVWLPGHGILGDDTDGHIDQVARFVDDHTVLVAAPHDPDADEAADLRANFDAVRQAEPLKPIALKMPAPKFQQGHRLPACYCNFYIANGGVIVPTFADPADDEACQLLQTVFPKHQIIGVDASDLIWGLGAFHCMTQQQPRSGAASGH